MIATCCHPPGRPLFPSPLCLAQPTQPLPSAPRVFLVAPVCSGSRPPPIATVPVVTAIAMVTIAMVLAVTAMLIPMVIPVLMVPLVMERLVQVI